jgi:hypothetical protein
MSLVLRSGQPSSLAMISLSACITVRENLKGKILMTVMFHFIFLSERDLGFVKCGYIKFSFDSHITRIL